MTNDVVPALDEFKDIKTYYTDTDSVHIHNNNYEILKKQKPKWKKPLSIKKETWHRMLSYGLFLAPKIKVCIMIVENSILSQKTTS